MPPVSSRTIKRSVPLTRSFLSGDKCATKRETLIGRRLQYRPSALRIPSSPFSGRISGATLSHLGPPTAPRSTASAVFADAIVASGSGTPVASIAAPPISCLSYSIVIPNFLAAASSTSTAASTISTPMPSPGSKVIFILGVLL